MQVRIDDDFDLKKIQISGQCFRVKEISSGVFMFITGDNVVFIEEEKNPLFDNGKTIEVSCSENEWKTIWKPYFDLSRNYESICKKEYGKHEFTDRAIDFGRGLRILKQDKWEMLISFIISQRKSIPAISSAVNSLSVKFGTKIEQDRTVDEIFAFPTPDQMAKATLDDLKECGLGYRAPYVYDAIKRVTSGDIDLEKIGLLNDDELFEELMKVQGVGKKVSNCVCLFAYSRMGRAPVDVWISRAIDEEYGGVNPFTEYGENAGIIQQYIFYYEKNHPKMFAD
ncbi:DNA-3-methyladenine glycosylase family protein [Butyrivibrio sp. AE3004]|uniref:DNA-3-methyladenine glycosylase family protein n=1 Tax=Butyrivibrio sp. AE3004 TaxID=1506994 RepID=UPI0004944558|nr:DNA glycosylase [Butyrivibrio sp. AE3004]